MEQEEVWRLTIIEEEEVTVEIAVRNVECFSCTRVVT